MHVLIFGIHTLKRVRVGKVENKGRGLDMDCSNDRRALGGNVNVALLEILTELYIDIRNRFASLSRPITNCSVVEIVPGPVASAWMAASSTRGTSDRSSVTCDK
jgi:outer membrane receptor for monomeric catechols